MSGVTQNYRLKKNKRFHLLITCSLVTFVLKNELGKQLQCRHFLKLYQCLKGRLRINSLNMNEFPQKGNERRHETVETIRHKQLKKDHTENKFVCGLFSTVNPAPFSVGKRQTTSGKRETKKTVGKVFHFLSQNFTIKRHKPLPDFFVCIFPRSTLILHFKFRLSKSIY